MGRWGKNIQIEAAATALRGAYGFGDGIDKAQLDSILKREIRLRAGMGERERGQKW